VDPLEDALPLEPPVPVDAEPLLPVVPPVLLEVVVVVVVELELDEPLLPLQPARRVKAARAVS